MERYLTTENMLGVLGVLVILAVIALVIWRAVKESRAEKQRQMLDAAMKRWNDDAAQRMCR